MRWPRRLVPILISVMSLVALGFGVHSSWIWHDYARCEARLDAQMITVMEQRSTALDDMFAKWSTAKSGQEARAALDEYRRIRTTHPLPPSPDDVCH